MKSARDDGGHRIGVGASFTGDLRFTGRLVVDGTLVGSVTAIEEAGAASTSVVVIGPNGHVRGAIVAATVQVSGRVEGPVHAIERLDVLAGGRIRGEIVYRDLQVQHGAIVEGTLKATGGEPVALKLVANARG